MPEASNTITLQEVRGEKNSFFRMSLPRAIVLGLGWQGKDKISVRIAGANRLTLARQENADAETV